MRMGTDDRMLSMSASRAARDMGEHASAIERDLREIPGWAIEACAEEVGIDPKACVESLSRIAASLRSLATGHDGRDVEVEEPSRRNEAARRAAASDSRSGPVSDTTIRR